MRDGKAGYTHGEDGIAFMLWFSAAPRTDAGLRDGFRGEKSVPISRLRVVRSRILVGVLLQR